MSTHALIGAVTDDGRYRVRYLHADGYPKACVVGLHQVWCRHGRDFERTIGVLLSRDWSALAPHGGPLRGEPRGGGSSWVWVDGVGRSYPDHEMSPVPYQGQLRTDRWPDNAEWMYLFRPNNNLWIYGAYDGRWQLAGMITEWQFGRLTEPAAAAIQDEFVKVVHRAGA